jgi:malonyl-CoA O-methyltransferase
VAEVPAGQAQLVWANMALHGQADRAGLLRHWHAALAVGGFLMFSTLGPDTARELVALYQALGLGPAQAPLPDMHDLGDDLVHAGFADPVMDQEHLDLSWSSPQALLAELRQWGANAHPQRLAGLRTPRWHAHLCDALAAQADAAGRIHLSVELVYGHAFKAPPRAAPGAEVTVSLAQLHQRRRNAAG